MKRHFRLCSLHFESRIPSSSSSAIKPSSKRMRVSEGCINNMRKAKAGNELNSTYARKPATLAKQSIVCGTLKFREVA